MTRETTEDELLARIYASPADPHARAAYHAILAARGDPRAELIRLQTRQSRGEQLTAAERKRARDLVRAHWRAWVGAPAALFRARDVPVFRDGFLAEAALRVTHDAHDAHDVDERALYGAPVFGTLTGLTCARADLVVRPHMALLERLSGLTLASLAALAELPYALPVAHVTVDARDASPALDARIRAAPAPLFARLATITAAHVGSGAPGGPRSEHGARWLTDSWITRRAQGVSLERSDVPLAELMRMFTAHPNVAWVLDAGVALRRNARPPGPRLEVAASRPGALARLEGVDGRGWRLVVELGAPAAALREEEAAWRARYPTFDDVDVREPLPDAYEGGL